MEWPPCHHESVIPHFVEAVAKFMEPSLVRAVYPRFEGVCPECNEPVVVYASNEHFIYGAWDVDKH